MSKSQLEMNVTALQAKAVSLFSKVGGGSDDVVNAINNSDDGRETMHTLLQLMRSNIKLARAKHMQKPTMSLPFGCSLKHAAIIAKNHTELRELTFERGEELPTAVYDATRTLAVRRALLAITRSARDDNDEVTLGAPIYHSGIPAQSHIFIFKIPIGFYPYKNAMNAPPKMMRGVIDYHHTDVSLQQIIGTMELTKHAEMSIILPYSSLMVSRSAGNVIEGGYAFRWTVADRAANPAAHNLPSDFFRSDLYRGTKLLVQPFGSNKALRISRNDFLTLVVGPERSTFYSEIRSIRNGFADIALTHTVYYEGAGGIVTSIDRYTIETLANPTTFVPEGKQYLDRRFAMLDAATSKVSPFGHQYALDSDEPLYVEQAYWTRASNHLTALSFNREVITHLLRHLFAYSQFVVYNGAIVTVDQGIDAEDMCVIAEHLIKQKIPQKRMLEQITAMSSLATAKDRSTLALRAATAAYGMLQSYGDATMSDAVAYLKTGNRMMVTSDKAHRAEAPVIVKAMGVPRPMSEKKTDAYDRIVERATVLFPPGNTPFKFTREEILRNIPKSTVEYVKQRLRSYEKNDISVEMVQAEYDTLFPSVSLVDPTIRQIQVEKSDYSFVVDTNYFKMSVPMMFTPFFNARVYPSRLRTSIGSDLFSSTRSMMASLMKRTFNRSIVEQESNRYVYAKNIIDLAVSQYGIRDYQTMRAFFKANPLTVSPELIAYWASNHTEDEVVSAANQLGRVPDFSQFSVIQKGATKPKLDMSAAGSVGVGQVVIFHTKDKIALTVGLFVALLDRIMALFPTDFLLAFGADEHSAGTWADKHLNNKDWYVYEIDMPKFDKSQHAQCAALIIVLMREVGVAKEVIDQWQRASEMANVKSHPLLMTFTMMFGNRSGVAGTIAINCLVVLFAFLDVFGRLGIKGLLIKGDDSLLCTKYPITQEQVQAMQASWGLSMKIINAERRYKQFCSGFFVKNENDLFALVRDPVRVIEKFGRALSADKPSAYYLDYYASIADTAMQYDNSTVQTNLRLAVSEAYGASFDVGVFIRFIQYMSSSPTMMLKELYGLNEAKIKGLQSIDAALEILLRRKSVGFAKASSINDVAPELRQAFTSKMLLAMSEEYTVANPRHSRCDGYGIKQGSLGEHADIHIEAMDNHGNVSLNSRYTSEIVELKRWQDLSDITV